MSLSITTAKIRLIIIHKSNMVNIYMHFKVIAVLQNLILKKLFVFSKMMKPFSHLIRIHTKQAQNGC